MKNKKIFGILLLIILLGLLLRVYEIGKESFWIDEAATVYTTQQKPSEIIEDIYATTKQAPEYFEGGGTPPFYFLLANYWTQLVGLSETKLRLLSAIFGVISVFVIFIIGKMFFDYSVGLIAAFILSINFFHINYSQEARTYSWITLVTLLTVYFLINALNEKKRTYWMAYILSAVVLIYSHYFGFFILAFEYLYLLLFWKAYRRSLKSIIISALSIFILYLPWIPVLLRQVADSGKLAWYLGKSIPYDLARIFVQFNSWFVPDAQTRIALRDVYNSIQNFSTTNFSSVSFINWLTIISVLALTLLLLWHFIISVSVKNNKISVAYLKDKKYIFLLMWFIVPMAITVWLTIIIPSSPVFGFIQHVLYVSPAYYLIVANGILKTKKYVLVLALIALLSILPLYSYYVNFDKHQWREIASYLEGNRLSEELVVVHAHHNILVLKYYYKDMENVVPVRNVDELKSIVDNQATIWLIYASEKFFDTEQKIKKYLDENYKISRQTELTGVRILHYTK